MSADYLRECPQCRARKKNTIGLASTELAHAISENLQYTRIKPLQDALDKARAMAIGTVPEYRYIELGRGNVLDIQIGGECDTCGFSYSVTHKHQLRIEP